MTAITFMLVTISSAMFLGTLVLVLIGGRGRSGHNMSEYLVGGMFNHLFGATALAKPTGVYVALYTSDPTPADIGAEVLADDYARQPITFSPASDGVVVNATEIRWPKAKTAWGKVTHVGIRDALTGGNLLWGGPWMWRSGNGRVEGGAQFVVDASALEISLH